MLKEEKANADRGRSYVIWLLCAFVVMVIYPSYSYGFDGVKSCTHRGQFGGCGEAESGHCNQKNYIYDAQGRGQILINEYTRSGNRIVNLEHRYNQQGVSFEVSGTAVCGGVSTNNIKIGEWSLESRSGTMCWDRHVLISTENCVGETVSVYHEAAPANLTAIVLGQCGEGCCVVDDDSSNKAITGLTGDDMMAMFDEREAFHEFKQGVCDDVYWLSRVNKPGPDNPLMIPSKCPDYERFIEARSGGAIAAEPACRPSLVRLCPLNPKVPPPPVEKGCGACVKTYAQMFPFIEYESGGNVCAKWEYPAKQPYNIIKGQCVDQICRQRDSNGNCTRCVPWFRDVVMQHTVCTCGVAEDVTFTHECRNDCAP